MDTHTIFTKTVKAKELLANPDCALEPRERTLLKLINGHASVADFMARGLPLSELRPVLERLLHAGLITLITQNRMVSHTHYANPAIARQEMVRAMRNILGEEGNAVLAKLAATPANYRELREATRMCIRLVKLTIDEDKAYQIQRKFADLLNKTN